MPATEFAAKGPHDTTSLSVSITGKVKVYYREYDSAYIGKYAELEVQTWNGQSLVILDIRGTIDDVRSLCAAIGIAPEPEPTPTTKEDSTHATGNPQ